jgi:hypothetical protein
MFFLHPLRGLLLLCRPVVVILFGRFFSHRRRCLVRFCIVSARFGTTKSFSVVCSAVILKARACLASVARQSWYSRGTLPLATRAALVWAAWSPNFVITVKQHGATCELESCGFRYEYVTFECPLLCSLTVFFLSFFLFFFFFFLASFTCARPLLC